VSYDCLEVKFPQECHSAKITKCGIRISIWWGGGSLLNTDLAMNITFGGLVFGAHTFLAVQMFAEPQTAAAGPSQANNPKESSRKESERTVYLEQTVLTHTHTHTLADHTRTRAGEKDEGRGNRKTYALAQQQPLKSR